MIYNAFILNVLTDISVCLTYSTKVTYSGDHIMIYYLAGNKNYVLKCCLGNVTV